MFYRNKSRELVTQIQNLKDEKEKLEREITNLEQAIECWELAYKIRGEYIYQLRNDLEKYQVEEFGTLKESREEQV